MAEPKELFRLVIVRTDGTAAAQGYLATGNGPASFQEDFQEAITAEDVLAVHSLAQGPRGTWVIVRSMIVGG